MGALVTGVLIVSLNWQSFVARLLEVGLGHVQLSCWPKGFHGNPQTNQAATKTKACSLQTDNGTPFPRAKPIQLTGYEL